MIQIEWIFLLKIDKLKILLISQINMEESNIYGKEALEKLDTFELLNEIEESCEECDRR